MILYVYGTGCAAGDLIDEALPAENVTAFVGLEGGGCFLGKPVITLEELARREFDLLIVADRDAERVENACAMLGIDASRLLFLRNHMKPVDRNRSYEKARILFGDAFTERLRDSERLIRVPLWTDRERIAGPGSDNDYVRLKTLEAICRRLEDVPGAAAELGVNRGGFARWINELLPDRTLYLFDTFTGFDPVESRDCGEGLREAHRNTGVETVLTALPNPDRAAVRQGLFPGTASGLEGERFALVSLDADLEESTLAGLRFFVPRMNEGGYILLHDYTNPKLAGVRRALERYESENGRFPAVPLCDVNGTLVISV